jgi:hypothetical protein
MERAKRGVEYPPQSSDFCVWGDLKNTVHTRKTRTLQELRHKIQIAFVAIPPATLGKVCDSVACYYQQCIGAVVNILNICEFKITFETVG